MTSEPLPTDVLQDRLDAERAALIREFAATTPAAVVEGYVAAVVAQYKDAQVLSFVPILVRRHVREQLLASTPGNLSPAGRTPPAQAAPSSQQFGQVAGRRRT